MPHPRPTRKVHPVRGAARARERPRPGPGGPVTTAVADGRTGTNTAPTRRGESRWPAATAIVVAIALQIVPEHLVPAPLQWLLPGLELAALLILIVFGPSRLNRESRAVRTIRLTLTGLLSLVNGWSATWLVLEPVYGRAALDAGPLLGTGAAI
jgi:hypothetical protein